TAVRAIRETTPDVLFLDVQMPGMSGFDVLDATDPTDSMAIVFVTAFDEHAIRAFDACALDYLLKPVAPERLAKSLARVRKHLSLRETTPPPRASVDSTERRFSVRSGQRTSFVAPNEIDWVESNGNYAILHVGAQNHLL